MFEENWDTCRRRISKVQRVVRRETNTWVIVGSCFVIVFALLFILVRLWALHGIRVSEVQAEARNVLTHELGVPAFIVDRDSKIIDINHAAEAHFDVAKGGATGRYLTDFITYDEVDTASGHSLPTSRRAVFIHPRTTKKSIFVAHTIRLREIDGSEKFTIVCHDTTTNYELEIQKKVLSRKWRLCVPHHPYNSAEFCHEARNKYTPAATMLEMILTLVPRPADDIKRELLTIQDELSMSLALLHEADMLITTRMNLYKLYSGNYDTKQNTQIVAVADLLQSRIDSAATFAPNSIRFSVQLPPAFSSAAAAKDLAIKIDTYVFNHLCNNRALSPLPPKCDASISSQCYRTRASTRKRAMSR